MDLNLPPDGYDEEQGELWMHEDPVIMTATSNAQKSDPNLHEEHVIKSAPAIAKASGPSGSSLDKVQVDIATAATAPPTEPSLDAGGESHMSHNTVSVEQTTSWKTNSSNEPESDDEVDSTPSSQKSPQTPFPSMSFDSWQEAKLHYNKYAKHVGFSIKSSTSRRSTIDNEKDKYLFVCNKNGRNNDKLEEVPLVKTRSRSITKRTDCKARLRVKRIGAKWEVTFFEEQHTHELIKKFSLKKFLRSHRHISKEERDFVRMLHAVNLSSGKIMHFMSEIYGGLKNVPYKTKDVSNLKATFNELEQVGDMGKLLEHFDEMKKEDPAFFYKLNLDHHHRVESLFWVDGAARTAYKMYNDCLSFDTTYLTNMYNMPCAPFIGINRYGQSIQLGCGFIRNERIDNFVWLFQTFLAAMEFLQPKNMITDQDIAMKSAITEVFPTTVHRNCRWHIMKKAQEKLGNFITKREALRKEFNNVLDCSMTPDEFEQKWAQMIEKHDVGDNTHLLDLYALRECFVPAYFKDHFFPFLQTTARSEGFNAVLKKYVNPHNSIFQFFLQYKKLQESIEVAEDEQEFEGEDKILRPWSDYPMEEQAMAVYTRPIYLRFRAELRKVTSYNVQQVGGYVYEVVPIRGFVFGYGDRSYTVEANLGEKNYSCECSKFHRDGLLCCHVYKVMIYMAQTNEIPEQYILARWCNQKDELEPIQFEKPTETTGKLSRKDMRLIRYGNMCQEFTKIAANASSSDKITAIAKKHMAAMELDVNAARRAAATTASKKKKETPKTAPTTGENQPTEDDDVQPTQDQKVEDPPSTITKGRPVSRTKKTGLGIKRTRPNECNLCGSREHTSARCPLKLLPEKENLPHGV